jgi:two-component system OmpR family response regulator
MKLIYVGSDPHVVADLKRSGSVIDVLTREQGVISRVRRGAYDCAVLDIDAHSKALDVCRALRHDENWIAILLLCRGEEPVRIGIDGLDAGADDFIPVPYSNDEILARVRALARRTPHPRPSVLNVGDLHLDPSTRIVQRDGHRIELVGRQFGLLEFLMRNSGIAMSRMQILESVWGFGYDGTSNVVDVYIGYLRRKIDRPFGSSTIKAVRGVGYMIAAEPDLRMPSAVGDGRHGGSRNLRPATPRRLNKV